MSNTLVQRVFEKQISTQGSENAKVVLPIRPDNYAVLPADGPPRVYPWYGPGIEIDLDIHRKAASMDFRTNRPLGNGAPLSHNPELAVAFGPRSAGAVRYDLAMQARCGIFAMPDASCVAYSNDGKLVAVGSSDGMACVYKIGSRNDDELLLDCRIGRKAVSQLAFSATKKTLYVVMVNGDFVKIDVKQGSTPALCMAENLSDGSDFNFECYAVDCHPQLDKLVAFGGDDGNVYLVDYEKNAVHTLTTGLGMYIRQVHFLANCRQLAVVGQAGVEVWGAAERSLQGRYRTAFGKAMTCRHFGGTELTIACVPG